MDVAIVAPKGVHARIAAALVKDGIGIDSASEELPQSVESQVDAIVLAVTGGGQAEAESALRDARVLADSVCVVLVVDDLSIHAGRALDAGAAAVVWVSQVESTLSPTVGAVVAGQLVVPGDSRSSRSRPSLSAREKQVLGLIVLGLSNGEIARKLFLTESTVKSHLATAFKKLGVGSRKEAVARILDPADGLGIGILSITDTERIGDSWG